MVRNCSGFVAIRSPACSRRRVVWLILAALGMAGAVHAAEDPYLKALQSEAGKVEDLTKAQAEQRKVMEAVARQQTAPTPQAAAVPASAAAPASAGTGSRAELEKVLRDQFPGTFGLYMKFNDADKQLVVREFEASKATGIARYLPVINKVVQVSVARY